MKPNKFKKKPVRALFKEASYFHLNHTREAPNNKNGFNLNNEFQKYPNRIFILGRFPFSSAPHHRRSKKLE